jgi:hypothetical protein
MHTIPQSEALANLPVVELEQAIEQFLQPVTERLPDKRLDRVVCLAVQGISSLQSSIMGQMARGLVRTSQTIWAMAKHFYRLLANRRLEHRDLLQGVSTCHAVHVEPTITLRLRIVQESGFATASAGASPRES